VQSIALSAQPNEAVNPVEKRREKMNEPTEVADSGRPPGPGGKGKPVVLVPYYSTIENECEEGLRGLVRAGVALSRFSLSSIDLLRSAMLSHALR
jgi:hypothetical protein